MRSYHATSLILIVMLLVPVAAVQAQQQCLTTADTDCNQAVSLNELIIQIYTWYQCSSCVPDIFNALQAYFHIPFCGDWSCNATVGEDCSSCVNDCGCQSGDVCVDGTCQSGSVMVGGQFFDDYQNMSYIMTSTDVAQSGSLLFPTGVSVGHEIVPDSSTMGLWHLNGVASDSSGQGNDGTIMDDTDCSVAGMYSQGCYFDGSGDYIDVGAVDLVSGSNEMTVSAWVKMTPDQATASDNDGLVSQDDNNPKVFVLRRNTIEAFVFHVYDDSGVESPYLSTSKVQDTNWHHVVGVKNSTNVMIYLDGIINSKVNWGYPIESSATTVEIGRGNNGNLNGTIDDVAVWNRALSGQEIQDLYQGKVVTGSFQSVMINSGSGFNSINMTASATGSGYDVSISSDGVNWCKITDYLTYLNCNQLPSTSFMYKVNIFSNVSLDSIRFDWQSITCTDGDSDGYYIEGGRCGASDCDDGNLSVNPGMAEICGNGIDENCNGMADDPCLPCASLGGTICTASQICQGGNFVKSQEGPFCCISGTCTTPPITKQQIVDAIYNASHAYWDQKVVINRSGAIYYGYSGTQTVVDPSNPDNRCYDSDASPLAEPHIFHEYEDSPGHSGAAFGYLKAYEATGDKFLLRAAKSLGDTLLSAQQDNGCGGWYADMGVIGYDQITGSPTYGQEVDFGKWMNYDAWNDHGNIVIEMQSTPFGLKEYNTQNLCSNDGVSWVPGLFLLRLYQIMPASDPDRDGYLQGAKYLADNYTALKDVVDADEGFMPYDIGGIPQMWPYNIMKDRVGIFATANHPSDIAYNAMPVLNDNAMTNALFFLIEFWQEARTNPNLNEQEYLDAIRLNIDYLIHVFDVNANPGTGRGSWGSQYWINDGTANASRITWGRTLEPPAFGFHEEKADDALVKWWTLETDQNRKYQIEDRLEKFLLYFKYDAPPVNSNQSWINLLLPHLQQNAGLLYGYDPNNPDTWGWWIWYNHDPNAIDRLGNPVPLNTFVSSNRSFTVFYGDECLLQGNSPDGHYPMIQNSVGEKIISALNGSDNIYLYNSADPQHNSELDDHFNPYTDNRIFSKYAPYPVSTALSILDPVTGFFSARTITCGITLAGIQGQSFAAVSDYEFSMSIWGLANGLTATPGTLTDSDGDGYGDAAETAAGTDIYDSEVYPGHDWYCGDGSCDSDENNRNCGHDC